MEPIKRHRIDWDNIPIIIVPADKENPNPLNPCSRIVGAHDNGTKSNHAGYLVSGQWRTGS